ncbi:ABC transporter ATP-binding protein [Halobaculum rubrum]|uniref:ABC transporter ATP-binding protein n=1 Tax=Halobaculum rubrum TaxID=2872158 RepID=UPI001CA3F27B|nr:ABC transporter ATP-binding protein [Halobaculum rubrum]QZX99472.1 ABC transporter ATP-binding protein [Halobaculum rubrum]
MARVQLTDVTKRYEDVTAVEGMNLDIEDGEFITLVGPSGCGKSTTMEMIAGLTMPSDGTIHIGERDVTTLPPKDRGISMVFQNIALFPHMDVYDNISFGLRLRNYEKEEIDRRVDDAARVVQMEGMLDRMPDEMSGGQRQRIAIARAIVREPEVFLMDEPLANLDAKLRVHMRTELQRLHRELETTIIYVTHDQAEAMTMSDRIAVLNEGELQQFAAPLTCYNEPTNEFVAGFIGSPAMNFTHGELTASGFSSAHYDVTFPTEGAEIAPGTQVTLGVRPEDVYPEEFRDDAADPTELIDAEVDVMEPMGDEIFVYLMLAEDTESGMGGDVSGDDSLLMSVSPDSTLEEGDRLDVALDRAKVHLFDDATGEALVHGVSRTAESAADARGEEAE